MPNFRISFSKFLKFHSKIFFFHKGEKHFIDLLKRAQTLSLEDQRGRIDSASLQIPEFLLTSSILSKSQSVTQNLCNNQEQTNSTNENYATYAFQSHNLTAMSTFNKSSVSLPIAGSVCFNHPLSLPNNINPNVSATSTTRSRSPVVIVYDNEDYENLSTKNSPTPNKNPCLSSSSLFQNNSQISYV